MNKDEFDQFILQDAMQRCGLTAADACAKIDHYTSVIHHAIVRLRFTESDAERRAALEEIEQDISNIQTRNGWGEQMMSAFHARQQAVLAGPPRTGSAIIPKTQPATRARPRWLAWLAS